MGLREDQAGFFGKVGALMSAGVAMLRAFEVAQERVETPALKASLKRVLDQTYSGSSVTEAFASEAPLFTPEVLCLLQAGEEMGDLEKKASAIATGLKDGTFDPGTFGEDAGGPGDSLDELLAKVLESGATDVHVEPLSTGALVRYRIGGVLQGAATINEEELGEILVAARRRCRHGPVEASVPFDGWFEWEDRVVKVSTCPYATGDALVLRVLDGVPQERRLEDLGLSDASAARVRTWLADGHGLVIVGGVRGSGRSATLSALLSEIDRERGRVSVVGDGPGILVPGVGRVRLRPEEGFGRAAALRVLMRQDLDAVAVTNVSDPETLSEAVAVALAGHLVIMSTDADGAPDALLGMIDAGVNPRILAETVRGVLVQRLLRSADGTDWVPVFEIMGMTGRMREALRKEPTATSLARAATADGLNTLAQVAAKLVEEGLLARREVERVLGE